MPFTITRADIAQLRADAIVNSTGSLSSFGGAEKALFEGAGSELIAQREALGELVVGDTKVTPAFKLAARYVLHVRAPMYIDGKQHETELLELVYLHALEEAETLGCDSIAFPLIGAGSHHFPRGIAMDVALGAIKKYLVASDMFVQLVIYEHSSYLINRATKREFDEYLASAHLDGDQRFLSLNMNHLRAPSRTRRVMSDDFQSNKLPHLDLRPDATFHQSLFRLIEASGMNDVQVYKKANIDRKLFSKIRSNIDYQPSKNTVLLFTLALQLNLDQTKDLLLKAGYALSPSTHFDLIIEYCIDNELFDIYKINQVLFSYTNKALVGI